MYTLKLLAPVLLGMCAEGLTTGYSVSEKSMTYDQMIAEGWTMTADGFWIKE